jgi:hypothetical protein
VSGIERFFVAHTRSLAAICANVFCKMEFFAFFFTRFILHFFKQHVIYVEEGEIGESTHMHLTTNKIFAMKSISHSKSDDDEKNELLQL